MKGLYLRVLRVARVPPILRVVVCLAFREVVFKTFLRT